jgi:hypothetical protein
MLTHASPEIQKDPALVLLAAAHAGAITQPMDISPKWVSVLAAAAPELQGEKEIALAACRAYDYELAFAAPALQADRDVVLASGARLDLLPPGCPPLADREVVKLAISKRPENLKYASAELRDDLEIVMEATAKEGLAGAYASARLLAEHPVIAMRLSDANEEMARLCR